MTADAIRDWYAVEPIIIGINPSSEPWTNHSLNWLGNHDSESFGYESACCSWRYTVHTVHRPDCHARPPPLSGLEAGLGKVFVAVPTE